MSKNHSIALKQAWEDGKYKNRKISKDELSKKTKQAWENGKFEHIDWVKFGIKNSKGKFKKGLTSLFELNNRTRLKIMRRLNLPCSRCNWDEEICDLHHIYGRKIENAHNHDNLSLLCPNCHRLAGNNKINPKELISLTEYIGDTWLNFYYG